MSEENRKKEVTEIDQKQERTWAMICHLSPLLNFIIIIPGVNIFAPLAIWIWKKDEIPVVDREAKEVMNFQISLAAYLVVCGLLWIVFIGMILFPIISLGGLILIIMGAVKTYNGEPFKYPFIFRLIK